jgi:hypothetical protein
VSVAAAKLPPLDSNELRSADADTMRRERYLRKLIAEGGMSPSRTRLAAAELRALASANEKVKDAPGR